MSVTLVCTAATLGEDGRQVSIDFFGTEINGKSDLNDYVVTNHWCFPKTKADGGKELDIVLLVNGIPVAVGEMKTPVPRIIRSVVFPSLKLGINRSSFSTQPRFSDKILL